MNLNAILSSLETVLCFLQPMDSSAGLSDVSMGQKRLWFLADAR